MVDHCGPGFSSHAVRHWGVNVLGCAAVLSPRLRRAIRLRSGWIAVQVAMLVVVTVIVRVMA